MMRKRMRRTMPMKRRRNHRSPVSMLTFLVIIMFWVIFSDVTSIVDDCDF